MREHGCSAWILNASASDDLAGKDMHVWCLNACMNLILMLRFPPTFERLLLDHLTPLKKAHHLLNPMH